VIEIPDKVPLSDQDTISIMRCTICGAVVPGIWKNTWRSMKAGVDHILDRHRKDLLARRLRPPLFVNCFIFDPFWFEEHVPKTPEAAE
jgi:uroporphyrinogen-III decarboxylase